MARTDRNNRRRSHSTVDEAPLCHFFKIILADTIEEKKLHIPCKFVYRFGDELTDVANLILPNGRVWKIGLSKAQENNIWLDDGWENFAEHYSICHGHLLVFGYKGSSSFSVSIFNTTAYEIEYPFNDESPNSDENNIPVQNEIEIEDEIPSVILNSKVSTRSDRSLKRKCSDARDSRETHTKPKLVKVKPGISELEKPLSDEKKASRMTLRSGKTDLSAESQETEIITSNRFERIKATPRSERAITAAKKYTPKNPSFMVVLTESTSSQNSMYVLKKFVRYLKGLNRINLQVSDGRKWEVHLNGGPKRRYFGVGWSTFCSDNNLNEGDVCVFELVKDKDVLKVLIFNAV